MGSLLSDLAAAVDDVRGAWADQPVESLTPAALIATNEAIGRARRLLDAAQTRIASEIARQSRPELGPDSLAKTQGYRNPVALIAATTGTSTGDAARMLRVADATAPRMTLTGQTVPVRHPHVAEALGSGRIGKDAASAIISMLDRVAMRAGHEAIDTAEKTLAEQAPGLSLDQLSRVITRAEAWLGPDGVAPREEELLAGMSLTIREDRRGRILVNASFDPEHGAPLKTAIDAYVTAQLRKTRAAGDPDAATAVPRRSIVQIQAEALAHIAEHALGCDRGDLPLDGATVIVRIDHADLVEGTGYATIDGIATPISVATARRMAAGGGVISCVLGADSEILDWGRAKRFFTPAQRLALMERDGGCAMCGAPPSHTKAHHIRWWARDAGPTDLSNGVLLCESCHHHIHDNGWDIRIEGIGTKGRVWFIPPPHVDPARTPRLGGRARYDFAA